MAKNNQSLDLTWFYGRSKYTLVKQGVYATEAIARAKKMGGYLVEVDDKAENKNLYENIIQLIDIDINDNDSDYYWSFGYQGYVPWIWLGGSDKNNEGDWRWIRSNKKIDHSGRRDEWGEGEMGQEPDDNQVFDGQDYLAMGLLTWPGESGLAKGEGLGNAGSWNDLAEFDDLYFVVEEHGFKPIIGSKKSQKLKGTSSDDPIYAKGGNDIIKGGSGNDYLDGGSGNDYIDGGSGEDTAQFSYRNNKINLKTIKKQKTGDGIDRLISVENVNGGSGNDKIIGNNVDNILSGQNGNDKLYGGGGKDLLIGGGGKDQVWGQAGRDTFRVSHGSGHTIIKDFTDGQDRIHLDTEVSGSALKLTTRGNDILVEKWDDLMAVVKVQRETSSSKDNS